MGRSYKGYMVGWKRLEDSSRKRTKEGERTEWDPLDGISITFTEEQYLYHEGIKNKHHGIQLRETKEDVVLHVF